MGKVDFDAQTMAQQALEAWGLQSARCELVQSTENIVFRVDSEDGKAFVLCLHRPGYHTFEELISERQWTCALIDYGISVPVPVQALDERDFVLVEDNLSGEARYVSMSQWVDGKKLKHVMANSDDFAGCLRRLGEVAARIHNQASGWELPPGFTRHSLDADGLMGTSPFWGSFWASSDLTTSERARFEHLREALHDLLLHLESGPDTYSMIHADLHAGNLLVDNERLYVIDFDDAGFGWHMYELAVGLGHVQDHPRFPEMVGAVFEGYRKVRSLDVKSAALLPLFLLVRTLALVGWFADRPHLKKADTVRRLVNRALSLSAELEL
jgi:Ser/Thr protein kinase RdoA (MazF antagonist)